MAKLSVDQALLQAKSRERKGDLEGARALYHVVLAAHPSNTRARQALAQLDQSQASARSQREPSTEQINRLIDLYNQGQLRLALAEAEALVQLYPNAVPLWNILGAAHRAQGDLGKAVQSYQRIIEIKPDFAGAHNNLGGALEGQQKTEEAVQCYRRAIQIDPKYVEAHNNLGILLKRQNKNQEAIQSYVRALQINPNLAEVHNNMGIALRDQGKLADAVQSYRRALEIKPEYANAHNNLGIALCDLGDLDEATQSYRRALEINPNFSEACSNLGNALKVQGDLQESAQSYRRALEINPKNADAEAQLLQQMRHMCDWENSQNSVTKYQFLGIQGNSVSPFATLTMEDHPRRQMVRSINYANQHLFRASSNVNFLSCINNTKLRVGYFGADFHNHATLHLLGGLLRSHDRSVFEIFVYSYGRNRSGKLREQAERDVDHFFDIADLSDQSVVELVRSHKLHVAVDLKGYTADTRSNLFQFRLAPIQINYLGYPGTMGAKFIDYIIADETVIPPDQREFYTENVIYLPHSYQPNDDMREIAASTTTRADFGLPEDSLVLCCFNNNYKISNQEFDIWMRILAHIRGSALWLLRSNGWAEINLRKEAQARGIDPNRIIFADKLPQSEHLARHKHADLFIDTFNYNAHTTASDALWAGLPVVTRMGEQFAARVAASLLNAVGLPELVTCSDADYEALIVDLAADRQKINDLKFKLAKNRVTHPLFATKRYTRNFEKGLHMTFDLLLKGASPRDIWVKED